MDWNGVRERNQQPTAALPERIETCWRMKGPSGKVFECGIYRTVAPGVEVRCGYGEEDLLRSQFAVEIGIARDIAEEWRQTVLAQDGFSIVGDGEET